MTCKKHTINWECNATANSSFQGYLNPFLSILESLLADKKPVLWGRACICCTSHALSHSRARTFPHLSNMFQDAFCVKKGKPRVYPNNSNSGWWLGCRPCWKIVICLFYWLLQVRSDRPKASQGKHHGTFGALQPSTSESCLSHLWSMSAGWVNEKPLDHRSKEQEHQPLQSLVPEWSLSQLTWLSTEPSGWSSCSQSTSVTSVSWTVLSLAHSTTLAHAGRRRVAAGQNPAIRWCYSMSKHVCPCSHVCKKRKETLLYASYVLLVLAVCLTDKYLCPSQ